MRLCLWCVSLPVPPAPNLFPPGISPVSLPALSPLPPLPSLPPGPLLLFMVVLP